MTKKAAVTLFITKAFTEQGQPISIDIRRDHLRRWPQPHRVAKNLGTADPVQFGAAAMIPRPLYEGLPELQQGYVRFQASDGSVHDVPTDQLEAARAIDPGLMVIESDTIVFVRMTITIR